MKKGMGYMTENKRYKVAIYDEKAIRGYCVLDLENPLQTARLKYNNVFISTKEGCNIVCDLLNEQEERIKELEKKNQRLKSFRATTYSLINDYLLDNDEVNESWREVLTEIKEILKDDEKRDEEKGVDER